MEPFRNQFMAQVHELEAKSSIPDVAKVMVLIQDVQTDGWWQDATPEMVEHARRRLRGLMNLVELSERKIVTTDITDVIGNVRDVEIRDLGDSDALAQFRRKARAYIEANPDHLTLERLRQGKPLTSNDLDELQRLFEEAGVAGPTELARFREIEGLPSLIRSWVGLDRNAAKRELNRALDGVILTPQQLHFLDMIIDHLTSSGSMDPELLYKPPFTDEAPKGVSDVFELKQVQNLVSAIRSFEPRYA